MVPEDNIPVGGLEKAGRKGIPFFTTKYSLAVMEVILPVQSVSHPDPV